MTPEFDKQTGEDCLQLIKMALGEDIGATNLDDGVCCTSDAIVPSDAVATASFVARDHGIVCGQEVIKLIIDEFAPDLELQSNLIDGERVQPKQTIAVLTGPAHRILVSERTCLNFMCRLSGISSLTRKFVDECSGTKAQVYDTRKTMPGWRRIEKYAVACGGGKNHRMGLYDAVMIKDNHLAFFGSQIEDPKNTIPQAIKISRKWIKKNANGLPKGIDTPLILEVDNLDQLAMALKTDPDIILLDNMTTDELSEAALMRNNVAPKILLEASGGVNLDTIGKIARTGVERISVGALTHSAVNFDIGLDWQIG